MTPEGARDHLKNLLMIVGALKHELAIGNRRDADVCIAAIERRAWLALDHLPQRSSIDTLIESRLRAAHVCQVEGE